MSSLVFEFQSSLFVEVIGVIFIGIELGDSVIHIGCAVFLSTPVSAWFLRSV